MMAFVPEPHASMLPFSLAKINREGVVGSMAKLDVLLKTVLELDQRASV